MPLLLTMESARYPHECQSLTRLAVIRNFISIWSRTRMPPRKALNGVSPSCPCVTTKLPVTIICSSPALTVAGNSRILV